MTTEMVVYEKGIFHDAGDRVNCFIVVVRHILLAGEFLIYRYSFAGGKEA